MTKKQKAVILIFSITLAVLLFYPPYMSTKFRGEDIDEGHWITLEWKPPDTRINIKLLLTQYLYVVTIGIGVWLFLKPRGKK